MARQELPIDWHKVDKLIEAQNTACEIAGQFGLTGQRLSERMFEKFGTNFTDYSATIYRKGKSNLRTRQYQKAMDGCVPLLLKLGEIYLDQGKDKPTAEEVELKGTFAKLMEQFQNYQSSNLKKDESHIIMDNIS